jgi:hypothetical protein
MEVNVELNDRNCKRVFLALVSLADQRTRFIMSLQVSQWVDENFMSELPALWPQPRKWTRKAALLQLERQTGHLVKQLRTDRGTEFLNSAMRTFCLQRGIVNQTSVRDARLRIQALVQGTACLRVGLHCTRVDQHCKRDTYCMVCITATCT